LILAASKKTQRECERAVAEASFLKKKSAKRNEERVGDELRRERISDLAKIAREKLLVAKGEWVPWSSSTGKTPELRPAHRDRVEYGDEVWEALKEMEDVEYEEKPYGSRTTKKAKIVDE
jgi:hypothetical protein